MWAECGRSGQAAAYVLGEMRGSELDEFARHLARCDACAEEVDLLSAAADAVPLLASRPLDAEWRTTYARDFEPDLVPDQPVPDQPVPDQPVPDQPVPDRLVPDRGSSRHRLHVLRQPVPKPVLAMFGALAVAAIITAVLVRRSDSLRYVGARVGWSGGGAVIKIDGASGELLVEGMPKAPAGRRYQLWVLDKGTNALVPTSAYLRLDRRGEAGVEIPADVNSLLAVAVFEEPVSGEPTERLGAVLAADLIPGTIGDGVRTTRASG